MNKNYSLVWFSWLADEYECIDNTDQLLYEYDDGEEYKFEEGRELAIDELKGLLERVKGLIEKAKKMKKRDLNKYQDIYNDF